MLLDFLRAFLDDLASNPKAYLPPRSSMWLWIGGPILLFVIFYLTARSPAERRKRLREAQIWRASVGPLPEDKAAGHPYRPDPKAKQKEQKPLPEGAGPARVASIPAAFHALLEKVGGGEAIVHYELVRDLAYLSLMEANQLAGSDHQTVTAKLEAKGPMLSARPLPVVDGQRVVNSGVQFRKDPELMGLFLIEGPDAKAIGKWLSPSIRRALCQVPAAWLRVEGSTMAVTIFGALEADEIDRLVELADAIFAEHGAEGGPSLFGEDADPAGLDAPAARAGDAPKDDEPKGKGASKKRPVPTTATTMSETPSAKKRF